MQIVDVEVCPLCDKELDLSKIWKIVFKGKKKGSIEIRVCKICFFNNIS